MIFILKILSPFSNNTFKGIYCFHKTLSKNKSFEVEINKNSEIFMEFNMNIRFRGHDHAGPEITLGLFSYSLSARVYDHRHWNYKTQKWKNYDN